MKWQIPLRGTATLNISSTLFYDLDEGFSTFDLADIYGPAEDYVGAFRNSAKSKETAKNCQVQALHDATLCSMFRINT